MMVNIDRRGIIKQQNIEFANKFSIIYGYNNSGKTTLLREINLIMYNQLLRSFVNQCD